MIYSHAPPSCCTVHTPPLVPLTSWEILLAVVKGATLWPNLYVQVLGPALCPTLSDSEDGVWVWAEALPGVVDRIQPGDIIVCHSPTDPHVHITSRLRALPGQIVQQQQPGQKKPTATQVPPGHMVLQGDHPSCPQHGPMPMALVQGRVVAELWPNFKQIERPAEYTNPS
eukprot:GHUV01023144.1.p1 GENE.GHUV01023144.1~~GHUV01023144.1.p1  ORF type:complete len:170 (+),score=39.37 GHUV01023144.1:1339-1848(+)